MQPYQQASQALREGEEEPFRFAKNLALTAVGAGVAKAGSHVLSKMIPAVSALINQHVPENLSSKGLEKIDPRFKKFISGALDQGYSYDDVRNFLGEKVQKSQEKPQAESKGSKNLIEQYDPELHIYMNEKIKKGESPVQAATQALKHERFNKAVKKLTKEHKTNWLDIVNAVYGAGTTKQNTQQQTVQQQPMQQPQQPVQQQAAQGPGPGQAALMEMLQKLQQSRGGQ